MFYFRNGCKTWILIHNSSVCFNRKNIFNFWPVNKIYARGKHAMPIVYHRSVVLKPGFASVYAQNIHNSRLLGPTPDLQNENLWRCMVDHRIWISKSSLVDLKMICLDHQENTFLDPVPSVSSKTFFSDWVVIWYFVCVSIEGKWRKYSVKGFCVFCIQYNKKHFPICHLVLLIQGSVQ